MINAYAVDIRRKLHMYPETGFDLEKTLSVLRKELSETGVEYTEKYGRSCIVATINPEKNHFTIGIRADMDALPIAEENDVEYKSKIEGRMHACGHDAHTAIALATLKELYAVKDKINCCVKFLFQSGEEGFSGAKYMVEDGVMNDIDCIVALHVDAGCNAGEIRLKTGEQNANADHFSIEFFGKDSHVARQQNGVDANMLAIKAYTAIEFMIAKEVQYDDVVIFNAGEIHGGTADNVISSYCSMGCTLRTWKDETQKRLLDRIKKIAETTAEICGGKAKIIMKCQNPVLINNDEITQKLKTAAEKVIGSENITEHIRNTEGEDFAYFSRLKPACMFRLGVANKTKRKQYAIHTAKFDIDEEALDIGIRIFKQFVFDNMDNRKD